MQDSAKIRPRLVLGAGAVALALGFGGGFALKHSSASSASTPARAAGSENVAAKPLSPELDSQTRYLIPVSESQPQRGPADALVTIVEWCDLRGDPCRAADQVMSELMKMRRYAGRLRWVHRQHIDPENFEQSLKLHAFARGAFQYSDPDDQEKFWQVREKLLALPGAAVPSDAELRRIAGEVGVDYDAIMKGIESKAYAGGLAIDNKFEPRYGITTTPAFFVNGRRVPLAPGRDMKQSIETLIQQEMVVAKRLADSGVTGPALYEELTKNGLWSVNDDPTTHPPSRFATTPRPTAMSMQREN
jgi:protein-disulfide isomerase